MITLPALNNSTKYTAVHPVGDYEWRVEIVPSTTDDHYHYAIESPDYKFHCSDKPVTRTHILMSFYAYDFNFDGVVWKSELSGRYETNPHALGLRTVPHRLPSERLLQLEIVEKLGIPCRTFVPCEAGIADIVTDTTIIEVKYILTSQNLFRAIGQVLVYRQAINPTLRPVIIGYRDLSVQADSIIGFAKQMGVEVIYWGDNS